MESQSNGKIEASIESDITVNKDGVFWVTVILALHIGAVWYFEGVVRWLSLASFTAFLSMVYIQILLYQILD